MNHQYKYRGALAIDDATYVPRDVDEELFRDLTGEENCPYYILSPRQMGKSSLLVRMGERLKEQDVCCIYITLQVSHPKDEETFYYNLLRDICKKISGVFTSSNLNLIDDLEKNYWNKKQKMSSTVKFQEFMEYKVLPVLEGRKIVFLIDEIQRLMDWGLNNNFIHFIQDLSQEQQCKQLTFVVAGIALLSDLSTNGYSKGRIINLGKLQIERCQPLLEGLAKFGDDKEKILQQIFDWTDGQPFLTQFLCDLVAKHTMVCYNEVEREINNLFHQEIVEGWINKCKPCHIHLRGIEEYFVKPKPDTLSRYQILNEYKKLSLSTKGIRRNPDKIEQSQLILSGLIFEKDRILSVANKIYREAFDKSWIESIQEQIEIQEEYMASEKILSRDVFILVDQSESMNDCDTETGDLSRWDFLKEEIKGDVRKILNHQDGNKKICDSISLWLFSPNVEGISFDVMSHDDIDTIFRENKPDTNTFIFPTIKKCIDTWKQTSLPSKKGAFFIIYTDGKLSDRRRFEESIRQLCSELPNQDLVKILLIGIGQPLYDNPEYYLDLDYNLKQNKDANGNPCDIFVFDLASSKGDIIKFLDRQLNNNKNEIETLPKWVNQRFPEWIDKFNSSKK